MAKDDWPQLQLDSWTDTRETLHMWGAQLSARVMVEAESRENSAAGFWPGGSGEGTFYAYAYPEPSGYRDGTLTAGSFDDTLGEWVLPYERVRTSTDPDATLRTFLDETYRLTANNGNWDRTLLEVNPHRLDAHIYHGADPVE